MRKGLLVLLIAVALLSALLLWRFPSTTTPATQGADGDGAAGAAAPKTAVAAAKIARAGKAGASFGNAQQGSDATSAAASGTATTEADKLAAVVAKPSGRTDPDTQDVVAPDGTTPPAKEAVVDTNPVPKPSDRPAHRQGQELLIDQIYGDLFDKLKLTPKQLAQLKKDLLLKPLINGGVDRDATGQPTPAGANVITDANSLAQTIQSLIGPENYQTYLAYEATVPYRNVVNDYQAQLTTANIPLSPAQQAQLLVVVGNAEKTLAAPPVTTPPTDLSQAANILAANIASQQQVNAAILQGAAPILTAAQLAALTQLHQQQAAANQQSLQVTQQLFQGTGQAAPAAK